MKLKMQSKMIAVEKLKSGKTAGIGGFVIPEISESCGIVKFSGSEGLPEGTKVYYGGKREEIRMLGMDLQVMHEDNVVAIETTES